MNRLARSGVLTSAMVLVLTAAPSVAQADPAVPGEDADAGIAFATTGADTFGDVYQSILEQNDSKIVSEFFEMRLEQAGPDATSLADIPGLDSLASSEWAPAIEAASASAASGRPLPEQFTGDSADAPVVVQSLGTATQMGGRSTAVVPGR